MKYFIIAGEVSGDLQISKVMHELKKKDSNANFRYIGGDQMKAQGGTLIKHIKEIAYMGFIEVLQNLNTIRQTLNLCKQELLSYQPDVLILVDYPGFNLRIAKFAKKHNIKVFYFIPPKIWAWKETRIKQIKKYIDKVFSILPFEIDFYNKYNYKVDYIGNPLIDNIEERNHKNESFQNFLQRNKIEDNRPLIAILPGSRKQEIKYILPIMIKMIHKFPQYQFLITGVTTISNEIYQKYTQPYNVKIIYNETYQLLQQAKLALVTSGTATLETALFKVPQLVCYKAFGGRIFAKLILSFIKTPFISLVNIIMNKQVVKEIIQHKLSEKNLEQEINTIINNEVYRNNMLTNYDILEKKLGEKGAAERTAKLISAYLTENHL